MPLRVDLLRHGKAAPAEGRPDADRRLTPDGIGEIRRVAKRLVAQGWKPDCVFSSPLRRARETDEILLEATGIKHPIAVLRELEPETDPATLEATLTYHVEGASHVLLVTHVPLVGRLVQRWCGSVEPISTGQLLEIHFDAVMGKERGWLGDSIVP